MPALQHDRLWHPHGARRAGAGDTLAISSGSCRDSGWLLVQILRHLGLAARFVSGYLIQMKADIEPLEGPRGTDKDFTDLHAWAEVYMPGAGWIGLDPTSGLLTRRRPSAAGGDAALSLGRADQRRGRAMPRSTFDFAMSVARVARGAAHHPALLRRGLGRARCAGRQGRCAISQAQDVRLTMGGEPTFVSIDDHDRRGMEHRRGRPHQAPSCADDLIRRLRERFAPGGMLHYGQGKWYPGESLPRWAFALYWRRDGEPIWRDADLIAREGQGGDRTERRSTRDAETLRRGPRRAARRRRRLCRSRPMRIPATGC